jgi:acyl-coenzyme A thioesterase PaaI-like protein
VTDPLELIRTRKAELIRRTSRSVEADVIGEGSVAHLERQLAVDELRFLLELTDAIAAARQETIRLTEEIEAEIRRLGG